MDGQLPETPAARPEPPLVSLTIGIDGRLYCHDIAPEMLSILEELCPGDPQLIERRAAARLLDGTDP